MPLFHNLSKVAAIFYSTGIVGSTSASNYAVIDTIGYQGVEFMACVSGTPSTNGSSINPQQGTSSGGGDMVDISSSKVTLSSSITDGWATVDVFRPHSRYMRLVHVKTSTADILTSVTARLYRFDYGPITDYSTATQHGKTLVIDPTSGTP